MICKLLLAVMVGGGGDPGKLEPPGHLRGRSLETERLRTVEAARTAARAGAGYESARALARLLATCPDTDAGRAARSQLEEWGVLGLPLDDSHAEEASRKVRASLELDEETIVDLARAKNLLELGQMQGAAEIVQKAARSPLPGNARKKLAAFLGNSRSQVFRSSRGVLLRALLERPEGRRAYRKAAEDILEKVWDPARLRERARQGWELIRPHLSGDPRRWGSFADQEASLHRILRFFEERRRFALWRLAAEDDKDLAERLGRLEGGSGPGGFFGMPGAGPFGGGMPFPPGGGPPSPGDPGGEDRMIPSPPRGMPEGPSPQGPEPDRDR